MTDLRIPHFEKIRESLTGKRDVVWRRMELHSPCTATELAGFMNWDKCSCRPRLSELKDAGLIEETGERRNSEHVFRFVSLAEAERRARFADQIEQDTAELFRLVQE